jgi:hypothetical protein
MTQKLPKFPRISLLLFYAEDTRVEPEFEVKKLFPAEFDENFSPDINPNRE